MSIKTISTDLPKHPQGDGSPSAARPVTHDLRLAYLISLLIVVLTGIASAAGILFPDDFYPTAELQQNSIPNDVVTLLVGLPILLGSMWLTRRGALLGLLFWPGAIFYGLYNYLVYLFAMPLTVMYPVYLAIVTLSIYTTIGLVASIDGDMVKERLSGRVPERLSGGMLIGLSVLVILLGVSVMANGLAGDSPISSQELGLATVDILIAAAWAIGGFMLWRQQALGYVASPGLLFQGSMLFIGAIAVLMLQPLLSDTPLMLTDIVALIVMGSICFVPFALFLRGIVRA